MQPAQKIYLDIKTRTILKIFAVAIGLWLIYLVKDVILLFVFVLILFSVLNPIVNKWEEEMSRKAAIISLFSIIILFILAAALLIIPPLAQQAQSFINHIPQYVKSISPQIDSPMIKEWEKSLFSLTGEIGKFGMTIFNTTIGVIGGLVAAFTVLVSTYYLLSDKDKARNFINNLPVANKDTYYQVINKISEKMGGWVRGQLLLMLIVGALDLTGLFILGIPFALTLGVWAGLTELVPYVGPVLGAIPAILIALSISPLKALLVLVIFLVVQQIEAQFLVPKIMGKAVGLSPVIIIFAVLIGAKLLGLLGVVLAIPFAAAISVLIQEWSLMVKAKD